MTIQPLDLNSVKEQVELLPQAVLGRPISHFALRMPVVEGHDDFDKFQGAALLLNGERLALIHYAGHPSDTVTVYLPWYIRDVDQITTIIGRLVEELDLPREAIIWQRADDPSL
jgi:hypothetical protein